MAIQPTAMLRSVRSSTARVPLTTPTPTTAPMIACDEETGIPRSEKRWTPRAALNCAASAPGTFKGVMLFPTVKMPRFPKLTAPMTAAPAMSGWRGGGASLLERRILA